MILKKIKRIINEWGNELIEHKKLILFSLFLIALSTVIDYNAGRYVTDVAKTQIVPDIFIDNIPPINLNFLFVYGWLSVVVVLLAYPIIFNVSKIHTTLSHFSLLTIVRSFFITLTHLETPLTAISVKFPSVLQLLKFENDLFFSGHTAIPFLGYLLFKESKIKYFFLISSIIMGITALLTHQHYTIDVLAAFFITYGTYEIGKNLFSVFDKN